MGKEKQKKENALISILINIVIPVLILTKLNDKWAWEPITLLLGALSFPLIYGIYDFFSRSKFNWISAIGVFSVLYTGIIGILELPPNWIAIKEAFVPFVIGVAVLISIYTNKPLLNKFLLTEELFKKDLILSKIEDAGKTKDYNLFIKNMTWFLAATFMFSSVLNYILAKIIVVSNPGTPEFNHEIGRLTALSFPVIALPSTVMLMFILFIVVKRVRLYTGLKFEEMVNENK